MTQPTERRFVMEPRLDAEVETLNTVISNEATARANADATKVAKAGDTMTGALVLSGDPTLAMHAATKQYVDAGDAALQTSINDVKQTSRVYVKNGASSLTKGTPVYITGADGTNVIIGAASNASEATSSKVIGLTETDLTANQMGYVVTDGKLSNIDTSGAAAAGDAVWLGVNGAKLYGLANKPVAPAHMVYLGVVSRKNANTGEIEVKVQNGFELDELHNVLISSPANGQALTYDSSTQLWKNATPASTLDALTDVTINSGTLAGGQVIKYDAGTTQWVNGAAAGGVTAAATAPNLATSAAGDAWFDTNDGTLYVCYVDVDSTKQWVQVQANSALEASILSRLGALEASNVAAGTTSPNYIINGGFDFWQRGTSQTSTGYGSADRWYNLCAGTTTVSQETSDLPTGFRNGIKYVTGASSSYAQFHQMFETSMVVPLRGKTVIFSFYAKVAGSYSGNIGAEVQYSNSNTDASYANNTVAVSVVGTASAPTSWTRMSFTFVVPSDALSLRVGIIPTLVQPSGVTVRIAGAQLELGNTPTIFRRNQPNIQAELAACQRYYIARGQTVEWGAANGSPTTGYLISTYFFPTEMRVAPTITVYDGAGTANKVTRDNIGVGSTNGNTPTVDSVGTRHCRVLSTSGGSATGVFYSLEASAEL